MRKNIKMTRDTFINGLGILNQTFRDREFDPEFLWQMLQDLNDEEYTRAVIEISNNTQQIFLGTNIIALIREKALAKNNFLSGEAFGELMAEISRTGQYGTPKFKDPVLEQTANAMGWKSLCASNIDDRQIIRSQFTKIYDSFKNRKNTEKINQNVPLLLQALVWQITEKK